MQIFHKSYFQFVIKYSSQNYISRISTFKIEIEFRSVIFQLSGANLACKSDQLTKKKKNKNEEIFDRLFNEFISNAFFQFETSESRGRNRRIGMEATMRLSMSCLWVTGCPRAIMKMGAKQRRDWWGIAKVTNCQHYCCGVTHFASCAFAQSNSISFDIR